MRPALRPGVGVAWSVDGSAVIGTRPGLRIAAAPGTLYALIKHICALDGSRTWDEAAADVSQPLLSALVESGNVIDAAGLPSTAAPRESIDACRSRVVDGDVDDPVALALLRRTARVALAGDPELCESAQALLIGAGVQSIDAGDRRTTATAGLALVRGTGAVMAPPPALCQAWLRAGIPHVIAALSGTRVLVGPLTVPGASPCASCAEAVLREQSGLARDAASDMLPGHVRPATSPETAAVCVGLSVGRLLLALDGLAPAGVADIVLLDSSGRATSSEVPIRVDCGCSHLPAAA